MTGEAKDKFISPFAFDNTGVRVITKMAEAKPLVSTFLIAALSLSEARADAFPDTLLLTGGYLFEPTDKPLPELTVTAVPEPTTMILLGTGLAGIGAAVRKRRRKGEGEES